MKSVNTVALASAVLVTAFGALACADKLPKSGVAMSAADVTALYSDHTAVWGPTAMGYFAADGTMKQWVQGTSKPGTWTVTNNEFFMDIKGVDANTKKLNGETFTECWQWFKDDKKQTYSLYSKHWDNSKPDMTNYTSNAAKSLKPGDLIGAKYVAPQN